jgi:hypothetical protein
MRRMMKVTGALVALSVAACTYTLPAPPAPHATRYVRSPYDTVWVRTLEFFASAGIPLQTSDKSTGVISSWRFQLPLAHAQQWADCGTQDGTPVLMQRNARIRT